MSISTRWSETYLRPLAFMPPGRMKTVRFLSLLSIILFSWCNAHAQSCSDADSNQLCADGVPPSDTLSTTPFNYPGCVNATQSYFYSFHTNSIADVSSMSVTINNNDCDDFMGSEFLDVLIVEIPAGTDPCDQSSYIPVSCVSDSSASFTIDLSILNADQDYMVIVGSDHDATYGPCGIDVSIAGDAVDIVAGVYPILVSLGDTAELSVAGADATSSINWSPPQLLDNSTSTNPIATPEETTSFVVTATVDGCVLTDVITLTVGPPVVVYNTFTPNGDGINDTWRIKDIERFANCQVEVFDRWGQSIFKSVGYSQQWDGTYKGRFLPTAAYYYIIELNSLEVTIPPLTGTISIVH